MAMLDSNRPAAKPPSAPFPLIAVAVLAVLTGSVFVVAFGTVAAVGSYSDVGYPDSATLLIVREFVRTGRVYLGIDVPPYLVTLYGPLTYWAFSVPYRFAEAIGVSPAVGVRLTVCAAILLCASMVFAISKRLGGNRIAALMAALMALSAPVLAQWSTQIRGDFPALGCALLGFYMFLSRREASLFSAAMCGTALLFKQTFVAAPLAILLWILSERRWADAVRWCLGVALVVATGYLIALWREPAMLEHLAALRHPVFEYRGALALTLLAISMPGVPFGAVGMLIARQKRGDDHRLLLLYGALSWGVAIITVPQAGSNINYFWEPLFVTAVFAGMLIHEIQREALRASSGAQLLVAMLCLAVLVVPTAQSGLTTVTSAYQRLSARDSEREKRELLIAAISERRILSTLPDITILGASPEVPDPFLNTLLERRGLWDSMPVAADVRAAEYELIIIRPGESSQQARADYTVRGVQRWSDEIWDAMTAVYQFACVFEDKEVWRARERPAGEALGRLGCGGEEPVEVGP